MGQKLRGFVGQGVGGGKKVDALPSLLAAPMSIASGSGNITAARKCTAVIYAWGGGGSGADSVPAGGGGGGGCAYKRVRLVAGQSLVYSVGAGGPATGTAIGSDGGDTTVTLPSGQIMKAQGGRAGTSASGGTGGSCENADLSRVGGTGGSTSGVFLPSMLNRGSYFPGPQEL